MSALLMFIEKRAFVFPEDLMWLTVNLGGGHRMSENP
jgi:hypothetical protein